MCCIGTCGYKYVGILQAARYIIAFEYVRLDWMTEMTNKIKDVYDIGHAIEIFLSFNYGWKEVCEVSCVSYKGGRTIADTLFFAIPLARKYKESCKKFTLHSSFKWIFPCAVHQ